MFLQEGCQQRAKPAVLLPLYTEFVVVVVQRLNLDLKGKPNRLLDIKTSPSCIKSERQTGQFNQTQGGVVFQLSVKGLRTKTG